jgi:membrane-bound ClpP family serine protease
MMGFGWMGIFLSTSSGLDFFVGFLVASGFGLAIAAFEIWLISKMKSLEQIPKFETKDCIGQQGQVYLKIPNNRMGEIQISIHGKRKIYKARSITGLAIESFQTIEVVDVESQVLVV